MEILKLKQTLEKLAYFTKQNLNLYLNKEGESLNYWIKKLIYKGILIPIKKGFYISSFYLDRVKERNETEEYFEYLSGIIRYPSYISLEYALAKYGVIPESVFRITAVTKKTTREYKNNFIVFSYRKIKDEIFTGYIKKRFGKQNIRIATTSKALFDFLYLKKFANDSEIENYLLKTGRINWSVLKNSDKKLFSQYVGISTSTKMNNILKILKNN